MLTIIGVVLLGVAISLIFAIVMLTVSEWRETHARIRRRDGVLCPSMYFEGQNTISKWAEDTFGPVSSNARVAARANEEMAELLRALTYGDNSDKAASEIADVFIVLYRLADRLGVDIHDEIDKKMAINRARKWTLDGTGHGRHVR